MLSSNRRFALTYFQRNVWFEQKLNPTSPAQVVGEYIRIFADIQVDIFLSAIRSTIDECSFLKGNFVDDGGQPVFVESSFHEYCINFVDLSKFEDALERAERTIDFNRLEIIDPLSDCLYASILFKIGPSDFVWYHKYHHISMDGLGFSLIAERVNEIYEASSDGLSPPDNWFGDARVFYDLEQSYFRSAQFHSDSEYWRQFFHHTSETSVLSGRQAPPSDAPIQTNFEIDFGTTNSLRSIADLYGSSVSRVLIAIFAAYTAKITCRSEANLYIPTSCRTRDCNANPGMVVNTIPLNFKLDLNASFARNLSLVSHNMSHALSHKAFPINELDKSLSRRAIHGEVAGPTVNIHNFSKSSKFAGGSYVRKNISVRRTYDLSAVFYLNAHKDCMNVVLEANSNLYNHSELKIHKNRLLRLLGAVAADADRPIGQIDLLDPAERHQILETWNATARPVPAATLPGLFEAQAGRAPAASALVFEGETLSYGELNARANRLARLLIGRGVGPESLVALALPRSFEMVVGLLGILKAGAAYLPLDVTYPKERLAFMLADAGPACLLGDAATAADLPETAVPVLRLDDPAVAAALAGLSDADVSDAERRRPLDPQHPAYVTYTSGSTGRPKGVVTTHNGAANFLRFVSYSHQIASTDIVVLIASISFDASARDIFSTFFPAQLSH